MTKLYFKQDGDGNRTHITNGETQRLICSGLYKTLINTPSLCVIRLDNARPTVFPEKAHYMGGGRLRHPFS